MNPDKRNYCITCNESFGLSKTINSSEILNFLKSLITTINPVLFEESSICESCLNKVQSALKFKVLFLENFQNIKLENKVTVFQNGRICEICNKNINTDDCIPLCDSVTETILNLKKYLSPDLELTMFEKILSCDECYTSLLDFYTITNLLNLLDNDDISYMIKIEVDTDKGRELQVEKNANPVGCNRDFTVNTDICDVNEDNDSRVKTTALKGNEDDDVIREHNISGNEKDIAVREAHNSVNDEDQESEGDRLQSRLEDERTNDVLLEKSDLMSIKKDECLQKQLIVILHKNIDDEVEMFKCYNCRYQTKHKDNLEKHMIIHNKVKGVKGYKCTICKCKMKYKRGLKRHMILHRNIDEVEMFKCHICEFQTIHKVCITRHMIIHKSVDEIEMFKCQICEFRTKHRGDVKKHMVVHRKLEELKAFKCKICKFKTKYKKSIKRHMVVHRNVNEMEIYRCNNCKFQTIHKGSLQKHVIVHKKVEDVEMLKCHICEFRTKYRWSFKNHKNFMHKELPTLKRLYVKLVKIV